MIRSILIQDPFSSFPMPSTDWLASSPTYNKWKLRSTQDTNPGSLTPFQPQQQSQGTSSTATLLYSEEIEVFPELETFVSNLMLTPYLIESLTSL